MSEKGPFELNEIEDVRFIIKAKGKNYSIVAKGDKTEASAARIAALFWVLETHSIVDTALEDLKDKLKEKKS